MRRTICRRTGGAGPPAAGRAWIGLLVAAALLTVAAGAAAETPTNAEGWVRLHSEVTGPIIGDTSSWGVIRGLEGALDVSHFAVLAMDPRQPLPATVPIAPNGQPLVPTAQRKVRFRKHIDQASVMLQQAWEGHYSLTAEFVFVGADPGGSGTSVHFFTVTVTEAAVQEVRLAFGEDGQLVEEVTLWVTGSFYMDHETAMTFAEWPADRY